MFNLPAPAAESLFTIVTSVLEVSTIFLRPCLKDSARKVHRKPIKSWKFRRMKNEFRLPYRHLDKVFCSPGKHGAESRHGLAAGFP